MWREPVAGKLNPMGDGRSVASERTESVPSKREPTFGWLAGLGALVGGFVVYNALAGFGGGVDWEDRLTFDQSGELELEGIGLILGLVAAVAIGAPLGAYLALRWAEAPAAGATALATLIGVALTTPVAVKAIPTEPEGPVLLPYGIFGGWFLASFVARWVVERGLDSSAAPPA